MIGRPKVPLVLTTPEQQALDSLAHRARTAPQVAHRARVVLACARGLDNQTVAKKLRVSPQMVGRWRARFVTRRVDGLLDAPRPGAPRTITDDTVEAVIVRTLETTPDGATHWSTRTLAKATGLSHGMIARIWRAFGLQPHRTKTCTLSPDPLLVEKVRDVVGRRRKRDDAARAMRRSTRRVGRSSDAPTAAIWEFLDTSNAAGKPFVWTKSADEILASIARFAQRTLVVHN